MNRRQFIVHSSSVAFVASSLQPISAAERSPRMSTDSQHTLIRPLFVSTWPFGKPANEEALRVFESTGSLLDAIEKGIGVTESDASNSSVGLGGIPNSAGVVQLDACIMDGVGHRAGSVAALEGVRHPIAVARRVMEKTPHVMLVGEGARQFAIQQGFEIVPTPTGSGTKDSKAKIPLDLEGHDTIAMVGLAPDGRVCGGCSTSGLGHKLPGRVGDSPILGGGLYVDQEVGAAGATGLGENVMRYCGSYQVVEFMRQGMSPEQACIETIKRIARIDPKGFDLAINFIAIDKKGRFGAAGTGTGFQYSVTHKGASVVMKSPGLTSKDVGPVGGNRH